MSNLTLTIKNCAIIKPFLNKERNYESGSLIWQNGTIDFKKNFRTFSSEVIAFIEAHKESAVEITGTLTKKEGKGDWAGKFFEEIDISEMKLAE